MGWAPPDGIILKGGKDASPPMFSLRHHLPVLGRGGFLAIASSYDFVTWSSTRSGSAASNRTSRVGQPS